LQECLDNLKVVWYTSYYIKAEVPPWFAVLREAWWELSLQRYNIYSILPNIFADFIGLLTFFFEMRARSERHRQLHLVTTLLQSNAGNEVKGNHRNSSETIKLLAHIVAAT
jgi:hypothetical protein